MNTKLILIAVVVILLLGGVGILIFSQKSATTATATPTPMVSEMPTEAVSPTAMMEDASTSAMDKKDDVVVSGAMQKGTVKEFTVTGSNFIFAPATMAVNKGDTVKITFVNDAGVHDFVLDEFGVKTETLAAGKSETVTFTASKVGSFEYYCSVGNHRQMGMVGTLTVK